MTDESLPTEDDRPAGAADEGLEVQPAAGTPTGPPSDAPEEPEFAAMLEGSRDARAVQEGETVQGVIVAIGPDVAFVDIGGKSEATIGIEELKDPEGDIEVEVGETIEAVVVASEGGLRLSRKLARGAAAKERIAEASRSGLPVEGRVEKAIKGGYEIRIAGERAFCPVSQIDIVRTVDPAVHEGKVYTFRIIEYKDGGKNIVVSRRVLLQEEEKEKEEEARKTIVPGAVLTGRVVSVREYGAFVDLGGVQGLLHVSEMRWARVTNPSEIVKPGDEISVKILRVDQEKGRISLGLKQLQADPWSKVSATYEVGQVRSGRVLRLQDFGAFVELEPGIEALAHVSTFPPTGAPGGWRKSVPTGTTGMFEILSVEPERKRIGVALVTEDFTRRVPSGSADQAAPPPAGGTDGQASAPPASAGARGRVAIAPGARLTGKVERHESFGVFIFLAPGRTGLMPASESGLERGADLRKQFPVGSDIEVEVLEVDPAARRIRLSRRAVVEAEERDDARNYAERSGSQGSLGTLGEKLRAALDSKK